MAGIGEQLYCSGAGIELRVTRCLNTNNIFIIV